MTYAFVYKYSWSEGMMQENCNFAHLSLKQYN